MSESRGKICDECWREEHYFTCHNCEEDEDKAKECVIGTLFALWERVEVRCGPDVEWIDDGEMIPGIYRIIKWPMYYDGIIEAGLYGDAFQWVSPLTEEMVRKGTYADYPCGPLCGDCQAKIEGQVTEVSG